jgi:hypothetical protein
MTAAQVPAWIYRSRHISQKFPNNGPTSLRYRREVKAPYHFKPKKTRRTKDYHAAGASDTIYLVSVRPK